MDNLIILKLILILYFFYILIKVFKIDDFYYFIYKMNKQDIKKSLEDKGYCIIENVLNPNEVFKAKEMFYNWYESVPNLDTFHTKMNPHGIFKYHQVGHQEFAWYLRTLPQVVQIFADIWDTNTNNLVCGFDGACYMGKNITKNTKCWTHTDQAPKNKDLQCYQGIISLTDNKDNSLLVYEGSHKLHKSYFKLKNQENESKNWQLIDYSYLEKIKDQKKLLKIPAGSLVLWDSRTFHQNIVSNSNEERLVQYICMKPKNNSNNSISQTKKRLKYFEELRTTSHWPYPIRVNGLQPRTFGNDEYLINYNLLHKPNLKPYLDKIKNLI